MTAAAPRASLRRPLALLVLAAALPCVVLAALRSLDVPLGKPGKFTYLYSPLLAERIQALLGGVAATAVCTAGVWYLGADTTRRRRLGGWLSGGGASALAVWSFVAPPAFRSQHVFNATSPSHDGAFLTEAEFARNVGWLRYLRDFEQRTRTPREVMRGTRVLSNPPGATILAGLAIAITESPALFEVAYRVLVREPGQPELRGTERILPTRAMVYSLLLWGLWVGSAPLWYLLAREALSPAGAAALMLACVFSMATLTFSPGKDPAQLLTAAIPLYCWRRAASGGAGWALVAGAAFAASCLFSLVHIWIGAAVLAATVVATPVREIAKLALWRILPLIVGAAAGFACAALAGFNALAALPAVAAAQALVTRGPDAMPLFWQLLGLPLFLLFCGAPVWLALAGPVAQGAGADRRFGIGLLVATAIIALATVGYTNAETPRLWIPFAALLLLGAAHAGGSAWWSDRRALAATLAAAHLFGSLAQWAMMDMREAENRLVVVEGGSPRFFE